MIISHESFEIFWHKHRQAFRRVCIPIKYKCLAGYFMVYHSKATESARLAEIVGLPKMSEKWSSPDFPRGYRRCWLSQSTIDDVRFTRKVIIRMFNLTVLDLPNKPDFRRCPTLFDKTDGYQRITLRMLFSLNKADFQRLTFSTVKLELPN